MSEREEVVIAIALRPEFTLTESWDRLSKTFNGTGADKEQIRMLRIMFFMGAAQAFARIDGNTKDFDSFCDIMKDVHTEIDDVMDGVGLKAGHA